MIDHNLGPDADVSAELLALAPDGSGIPYEPDALPIADGDEVHLTSRTDPADFRVQRRGRFTDVYAPIPLLMVTAYTGDRIQRAFCSPIAYIPRSRST